MTSGSWLGLTIAIETSTRRGSVAVGRGATVLEAELGADRAHGSDLLPAIDGLLRRLEAKPRELAAVVVGTGPGSYTGLRVGIATGIGLARGAEALVLGVPSGEVLAFDALAPGDELVHLLDARSGEVYHARYRRTAEEVVVVEAPRALRPEALAGILDARVPIFGDATVAAAARLAEDARAVVRADCVPRARALLALGRARLARGARQRIEEVEPLYLRPFAASVRRS